ncbi:MAG: response regulator, partial [Deltaproteobacteria bacterium]
ETLQLIFRSSVTTSDIITDISGRGLGLAIVREKAERLGGAVAVQTSETGTIFTIDLPVTVATFRGIIVTTGGQDFILPTASVEKSIRARREDIKTVENRPTVTFHSRPVPFVPLSDLMNLPARKKSPGEGGFLQALVVGSLGRYVAIGVDEIKTEQEFLVKGLGRQLGRVRNISGTALLESGRLVLILNPADLVRSAAKASGGLEPPAAPEAAAEKKTILVVEDSITSRILIKNILESVGYTVKTSVDGIEGLTLLKTEQFNLVVSDIEMPRMDGFELTKRVRADKRLADLPIILVTALETREDRELGIEAGANAYIVKSSFDQSNLLEVARRLM